MFIALYRWKLKDGQEARFCEGWHRRTESVYRKYGSLGSRLHQAEDGTWFAYAQWPDKATYVKPRLNDDEGDAETRRMMLESIETEFPDVYLEVVDDLLKSGVA